MVWSDQRELAFSLVKTFATDHPGYGKARYRAAPAIGKAFQLEILPQRRFNR